MIVNCVFIHVKPDHLKNFINASVENCRESQNEPGNLRFDLIQQTDDPYRFMLYEAYESEDAAANHKITPHYLKWRERVKDYMAEPRQGIKYKIIEPNELNKW